MEGRKEEEGGGAEDGDAAVAAGRRGAPRVGSAWAGPFQLCRWFLLFPQALALSLENIYIVKRQKLFVFRWTWAAYSLGSPLGPLT